MAELPWLTGGGLPWLSSGTSTPTRRRFGQTEMSPEELFAYQKQLASARLSRAPKPSGGGVLGSLGRVGDLITPDLVGLAMRQIGESLLYTPAGVLQLMDAARRDYVTDPISELRRGDLLGAFYPEHLAGIGKESTKQVYEDFRHPLRNPGYLAMDVFGIASSGASAASKLSLAAKEGRLAARTPSAPTEITPDHVAASPWMNAAINGAPEAPRFPGAAQVSPMFPSQAPQMSAEAVRRMQSEASRVTQTGGFLAEMSRYASGETQPMAWRVTPDPAPSLAAADPTTTPFASGQTPGRTNTPTTVRAGQELTRQMQVSAEVQRKLRARVPIDKTLERKLDYLEQSGHRASVEDGFITIHRPGEGVGSTLRDVVDEAYATEGLYGGLAAKMGETTNAARAEHFAQVAKKRLAKDQAEWKRTHPGEPFPATSPLVTDSTLEAFTNAERRTSEWQNRQAPSLGGQGRYDPVVPSRPPPAIHGPVRDPSIPEPFGPVRDPLADQIDLLRDPFLKEQLDRSEGLPIADASTGRNRTGAEIQARMEAEEARNLKSFRAIARMAGFADAENAARLMGNAGAKAQPISRETRHSIIRQRAEAEKLAKDKTRVQNRNTTKFEEIRIDDPEGFAVAGGGIRKEKRQGGQIVIDGEGTGVFWERVPFQRAAAEGDMPRGKKTLPTWRIVAEDRTVDIRAKNAQAAYEMARLDAVEKHVQGVGAGARSLDQPEVPVLSIDGRHVTAQEAVDIGLKNEAREKALKDAANAEAKAAQSQAAEAEQAAAKLNEAQEQVTRDADAAAAAEAANERMRIARAALGVPEPDAPMPPAVHEVLKEESPPELHDALDELAKASDEIEPLIDEAVGPTPDEIERQLKDMEPEEILSDKELSELLDEGDEPDGDADSENPFDWDPSKPSSGAQVSFAREEAGDAPGPTVVEHQGDFDDNMGLGPTVEDVTPDTDPTAGPFVTMESDVAGLEKKPKGRPAAPKVSEETVAKLVEEATATPPPIPDSQRGSNRRPRDLKSDTPRLRKITGANEADGKMLSAKLTAALRAAGVTGDSHPSAFKQVYQDAMGLTKAEADELYNGLHFGMVEKVKVTKEGRGSVRQGLEKILGAERYTPEEYDALAPKIAQDLKAMHAEDRMTIPNLREMLLKHLPKEDVDRLLGKSGLWESSGGSGERATRIFLRTLLKPSPRKSMALVRPDWEEVNQVAYEATKRMKGDGAVRMDIVGEPGTRPSKFGGVENAPAPRKYYRRVAKQTKANISLNPIRAGFQRFLYEYGVNRAPEYSKDLGLFDRGRARYAEGKFRFEEEERLRLHDYMLSREVEGKGALSDELAPGETPRPKGPGAWIDSANQLATLLTLYLKPGYVPPNMLGQFLFSTIDNAWNPLALARSYRFHRDVRQGKFGEERTARLHEILGTGMYESIRPQRGAVKAIDYASGKAARGYASFMDTPFREAAFYNEAYRAGFRTTGQIEKLLDAKHGTPLYEDLLTIGQNANRNIVDYSRLNKVEKTAIRRIVFFYPWIKGSTVYTARFASEHPFQFTAATQSARVGQERAEEILGEVPSYLKGLIPLGDRDVPGMGKLPTVMNPGSLSIFGSAGQALNAARGFAFGDVRSGEQLSEYFTPAITAAVAAATRVDPFTGARYKQGVSPLGIGIKELSQTVAPYRAYEKWQQARKVASGEKPADSLLFPSTSQQEAMSYLVGGMWPRTYNVKEGQERAASETLGLESKQKQTQIKWNDRTRIAAQEAKRLGMSMDKTVADAFKKKAERAAEYDLFASSIGKKESDLSQIERLQADMGLLVRRGIYTEKQAKQLLMQYSGLEKNAVSAFRTKLHRAYMGQALLTDFKSRLVNAGADEKLIDTDL